MVIFKEKYGVNVKGLFLRAPWGGKIDTNVFFSQATKKSPIRKGPIEGCSFLQNITHILQFDSALCMHSSG